MKNKPMKAVGLAETDQTIDARSSIRSGDNSSDETIDAKLLITKDSTKSEREDVKNAASKEINGPKGLEPTRYGDWESKGRCYDF